jgi:arylsulfatase A-like enzyme
MQGTTSEVSAQFAPESLEYLVSMIDELGSDKTYNHYPIGWAHAMDTPFQWTKQVASHLGGTRNGLAVSWPKRIKATGELRSQFHHVIDIVPTILEAANIQPPRLLNGIPQKPMEGVSMVYTFDDAKMPFKFTGTLRKVEIKLGANQLTPNQKGELQRLRRERALARQ